MREYELTFIIRPDLDDEAVAAVVERVGQTITSNGGQVLKTSPWGKRRLAYPIRRYGEGYYFLLNAELTDKAIRETERAIKLSEDIFRHLLVRVEAAKAPEAPAVSEAPEAPAVPEAPTTTEQA